jgi:hypothetical protein
MTINLDNKALKKRPNWYSYLAIVLCFFIFNLSNTHGQQIKTSHQQWLKDQFSEKHQKLIPIVAVADMYFSCNKVRKIDPVTFPLADLITKKNKNELADKLMRCLGDDKIKSDQALNFGLLGCFHQQLSGLAEEERKIKMVLVNKAILSLSREERQQSFTRCVNAQAINYLK